MDISQPTLPTIHLNGTGANTLYQEYEQASKAIDAATESLAAATCNQRDFYPQSDAAWQQALAEREEAFRLLRIAQDYANAWAVHAIRHRRD
jgi:CHASE3 domain sensor protein